MHEAVAEARVPGSGTMTRPVAELAASLREHKPLILLVAAFVGACVLLRVTSGYDILQPIDRRTVLAWMRFSLVGLALPLGYHLVYFHAAFFIGLIREPESYSGTLTRRFGEYRREHMPVFRVAGLLLNAIIIAVLISTFWAFKRAIPLFHPYSLDPLFMHLDAAVHLGRQPWTLLQPLFGSPEATLVIDKLYYLWFPSISIFIAWQGWYGNREARLQFLLSYALAWILLGTLMATILSSAGPCYYGGVAAQPNPFAPLMAGLYAIDSVTPLRALRVQEWLWNGYLGLGHFQGISAMPSMHVALPVLYALVSFKANRWLGWLFVAFTVVILVGSVHLGWHYAIDGYVSVAAVMGIWGAVGWFVRRHPPAKPSSPQ